MADRLTRLGVLLALIMTAVSPWVQAALSDPTQPPVALSVAVPAAVKAAEPVLQSVIIPKTGRPVAVIGGQRVSLGESYGGKRLIKLNEREAVLQGAAGIEHLPLTPGIEKTLPATNTTIHTKTPALERERSGSKQ